MNFLLFLILIQFIFLFISSLARDWVNPKVYETEYPKNVTYMKSYYFGVSSYNRVMIEFGKSTYSSMKKCLKSNLKNIAKCFKSYDKSSHEIAYFTSLKYTYFQMFNYYFSGYFLALFVDVLIAWFIFVDMNTCNKPEVYMLLLFLL
jgi:hypothetical protein